jgi:hypothetical protein
MYQKLGMVKDVPKISVHSLCYTQRGLFIPSLRAILQHVVIVGCQLADSFLLIRYLHTDLSGGSICSAVQGIKQHPNTFPLIKNSAAHRSYYVISRATFWNSVHKIWISRATFWNSIHEVWIISLYFLIHVTEIAHIQNLGTWQP